jgi:hypothetical protein
MTADQQKETPEFESPEPRPSEAREGGREALSGQTFDGLLPVSRFRNELKIRNGF